MVDQERQGAVVQIGKLHPTSDLVDVAVGMYTRGFKDCIRTIGNMYIRNPETDALIDELVSKLNHASKNMKDLAELKARKSVKEYLINKSKRVIL